MVSTSRDFSQNNRPLQKILKLYSLSCRLDSDSCKPTFALSFLHKYLLRPFARNLGTAAAACGYWLLYSACLRHGANTVVSTFVFLIHSETCQREK